MRLRVGIVGCGLIGTRRAEVASATGDEIVAVTDVDEDRANALAERVGATAVPDFDRIADAESVDVVVVATPNAFLLPAALAALGGGKHVLCEKPLGRNAAEAAQLVAAAAASGTVLKTGLNHRHHPALAQAHELAAAGAIGELFAVRSAYGHGGRPGYDREWRAEPALAGGGELLDQGVHLVDLARWFLGDFAEATGMLGTWAWDLAPLEDNAFVLLRTPGGAVASLHTSWTQWKNLFRFEVFGTEGSLAVEGLGGSYGEERLTVARRRREGGAPDEETHRFPGEDVSWSLEWEELRSAIAERREPLGSGADGYAAARVLDAVYAAARSGRTEPVEVAA